MEDDLEATQASFSAPQTQEELDAILEGMGASRPTRTIGATLSPTLRDDAGNPVPVDRNGEPIIFETNPDYDPNAKPSFANFRKNVSEMAEGVAEGAKAFASDPAGALVNTANAAGSAMIESGRQFGERIETGNTTLSDVFNTIGAMIGVGPATSVATRGVKATAADLANPNTSRIFLTPGTPGLTGELKFALGEAQDMADQGVDALKIKQDTGWEKFAGKEWVYEIDDSQAQTKYTAQNTNAQKVTEFTVPGGAITPTERKKLLLQAQRDKINLKKELKAGNITESEYQSLLQSRQDALTRELASTTDERTVTKTVPLAPTLKDRGKLSEVLYHPELEKYVDYENYTATLGTRKGKETKTTVTRGDHSRADQEINVFKQTPIDERKSVLMHEVEHFVDAASGSPGRGSNRTEAAVIISEAQKRYADAMKQLDAPRGTNPSILEDTVDMLDTLGFGMLMSKERLLDTIDGAITLNRRDDGTYESGFDMDVFKAEMKSAGNADPDLTIQYLSEGRPDILRNIEKIAAVRGSRDREIAGMDALRAYQNELGEVKARTVQNRLDLPADERRNSLATNSITYPDGTPLNTQNIYTIDEYQ